MNKDLNKPGMLTDESEENILEDLLFTAGKEAIEEAKAEAEITYDSC